MHGSSARMDADAGVNHNPPTLLQMSISRESDTTTTSEISVFEDSMSPEITDRNGLNDASEDSLYSPEERQYTKLKRVQELSVVAETTTAATNTPPQRRRPHSPRRQAHSTSKFYVDGTFKTTQYKYQESIPEKSASQLDTIYQSRRRKE